MITIRLTLTALGLAVLLSFSANSAERQKHRIEEASFLKIGGIEQWVTVRGDDTLSPIVLLVHGGPADTQSPYVNTYAPYERDFILVQWDQRGAGRTFAKNGAEGSNLSLDLTVSDGIELAEVLHRRFPKNKLVLLGHSWGTVVGGGMVDRRPELFAAYVGTGQVSSWAEGVQFQFDYLKEQYRQSNQSAALAGLEAIGKPDPLNIVQYFAFSRPLRQYMHESDKSWLTGLKDRAVANGEKPEDIKAVSDGMNYSGGKLIQTVVREDLRTTYPAIRTRYCVIQGQYDVSAPTVAAKSYFDSVKAPNKFYAEIPNAGHFALATHADAFIAELKKCLR